MNGRLIVFEGTDGSGKATQSRLLCEHLQRENIPYKNITFPQYGKPSAAMVQEYLDGNLGRRPGDVNAYAASLMFSMDRYASYKQDWGAFYEAGGLVIADRYTTSNAVHQVSKLPPEERTVFLNWLFELEYGITEKMMRSREAATGTHADIHEQDEAYLRSCREAAREIVKDCGWTVIHCAKGDAPRTVEDIHNEVYKTVKSLL